MDDPLLISELKQSGGFAFGGDDNNDNTSVSYVAEDSVSGFGSFDYDYDYDYDYDESETDPADDKGIQ